MRIINQNPFRTLGVLSNSPLKDRLRNQNQLVAFARVGRTLQFPNDFDAIIPEKPMRTEAAITAAKDALNLDKDRLKHALFWFIKASSIDEIALKHLQEGNRDKSIEILEKKETFSSLINRAIISFISGDNRAAFANISQVIRSNQYLSELLTSLGLNSLKISGDEVASMFISELLLEVPASTLLADATHPADRATIIHSALEAPISSINSAIAVAKSVAPNDAQANLEAGTKLMNSTKDWLKQVRDLAGASSSQYQMVADSLAKQILQCGINYYNNAPDSDTESPRKAMVLQEYALKIAEGKLTKDRCQQNYDILNKAVESTPPAAVAMETKKIKDEIRKYCSLPDKICHAVTLLRNTKPLLQAIKSKLGANNHFYLTLSTEVVENALVNLITEVNQGQERVAAAIEQAKKIGIGQHSLSIILDSIKPTLNDAWKATLIMDGFDMLPDFRANRYAPNRKSLKEMCDDLHVSTLGTGTTSTNSGGGHTTYRPPTPPTNSSSDSDTNWGCLVAIGIAILFFILSQ